MTLQELNSHLDMVTQLHEARDRLQSLRDYVLRAQSYDAMPHGTGTTDKVGTLAIKIAEQEETVKRYERIVKRSEADIKAYVDSIEDNRTNLIFYLRFISGYTWDEVAEVIGGRNTAEAVKAVCYRYLQMREG